MWQLKSETSIKHLIQKGKNSVEKRFRWVSIPGTILIVVVAILVLSPFSKKIAASGNDLYLKLKVMNDIIGIVNDYYVEVPDWDAVMEGAYSGLMDGKTGPSFILY